MNEHDTETTRYIDQAIRFILAAIADLRLMLDARYSAQLRAVDAALTAADKALVLAELSDDKRFDAVDRRIDALDKRITDVLNKLPLAIS